MRVELSSQWVQVQVRVQVQILVEAQRAEVGSGKEIVQEGWVARASESSQTMLEEGSPSYLDLRVSLL